MFSKSSNSTLSDPANLPKSPRASAPGAAPSIIGADVKIVGDMKTTGEIQLDGTVEGDVQSAALTLGENGHLKGSITAETVVIKGMVNGQISARSVRLEKTAKVQGDIYHEVISVESGAIIEGRLVNSAGAGAPAQTSEGGMKVVAGTADTGAGTKNTPRNASA